MLILPQLINGDIREQDMGNNTEPSCLNCQFLLLMPFVMLQCSVKIEFPVDEVSNFIFVETLHVLPVMVAICPINFIGLLMRFPGIIVVELFCHRRSVVSHWYCIRFLFFSPSELGESCIVDFQCMIFHYLHLGLRVL